MASQGGTFNVQEFSDLGALLVGGRLYTYSYGTTTQKTAYTDAAGATPHTYTSDGAGGQYIALNSRGELPAPLYLASGSYDLALKTATGATVWTRQADGMAVGADLTALTTNLASFTSASYGPALVGFNPKLNYATSTLGYAMEQRSVCASDYPWLAKFDGITDDKAAIQACIDWMTGSGGGTIILPRGSAKLLSGLSSNSNNVRLVGQGKGATYLTCAFASGDILTIGDGITNPNNWVIEHLSITSTVAKSSGAAIRFRNGHNLCAQHVRLESNLCWGVQLDGGTNQFNYFISDFEINSGVNGIVVGDDGTLVQDIWVARGTIYGATTNGVLLEHGSGLFFTDIDIGSGAGAGFSTFAAVGKEVEALWCTRVLCDTMAGNGFNLLTNGGTLADVTLTDCWASTCGTTTAHNGILVSQGSGVIRGVRINSPNVSASKGSGILLNSGLDIHILNPQVCNNGTASANTKQGIETAANLTEFSIRGGSAGLAGFYTSNAQQYGIYISTGNSAYNVDGVNVVGNTTAGIFDNSNSTTGSIAACPGFVTYAIGADSVAIGTAAKVITHGLAGTPTTGEIIVTLTSSMAASVVNSVWISAAGATTFQVNTNANVATNALTFGWKARIKSA